jgi:hypothetical protein
LQFDGACVLDVPAGGPAHVLPPPIEHPGEVDRVERGASVVIGSRIDRCAEHVIMRPVPLPALARCDVGAASQVGVHRTVGAEREGDEHGRAVGFAGPSGVGPADGARVDGQPG